MKMLLHLNHGNKHLTFYEIYKLTKKSISTGQVFLVPAGNKTFVPGMVLFIEPNIKGIILIGLYASIVKSKSARFDLPETYDRLIYTTQEPILDGSWPSVEIRSLRHNEIGLSKRLIGDTIWIENEKVGIASVEELSTIRTMEICNISWVEEDAHEIAQK